MANPADTMIETGKEYDGFVRCVKEWKWHHQGCTSARSPSNLELQMMRFAYRQGRKDGRQHK